MIHYLLAYWSWLRCGSIVEPRAADYGISETMAEVLRRQCDVEFRQRK